MYQGFSATDEGWLQAGGARIAQGQVPYRDFDYLYPPLTIYKEGALVFALGNNWTVFASRTLFVVEVSVAPVLVFLILRRFVSDRAAFLSTLPAIFFTVILAGFTSYTVDGEFMALLAIALAAYVGGGGRVGVALSVGSGVFAVLATMSKLPFIAFPFAIPFAVLAGRTLRRDADPPLRVGLVAYAVGAVATLAAIAAYFAAEGSLRTFVADPIILTQSAPTTLRFKLIQDLPEYVTRYDALAPGLLLVIFLLLLVRLSRLLEVARTLLLAAILALVLYLTLRHGPPPARPLFLIVAYGVVVLLGLAALATSALGPWRDRPLPPEIVFLALFLQWEAQFHYGGLVFWYEGTYLSVPVALLFVVALARTQLKTPVGVRVGASSWAAGILGVWLASGALGIVVERPYQDAPRVHLTASLSTPALHGVTTYPLTAQRLDGLVAQVESRTKPGDAIYILPDFSLIYEATGRRNPTRFDWPDEAFMTPDFVSAIVSDLQRDPPRLVFVFTQREGDYLRNQAPIDWVSTRWAPIYAYITAHYTQVDSVQDVRVLVPSSS